MVVCRAKVQSDLSGKAKVAIVVGQSSDQVVVSQQTWFGDKVDVDLIRRVCCSDVPNVVGLASVFFPFVTRLAAIKGLKRCSVGTVQSIDAAIAIQEVDCGSTEQRVIRLAAQQAIQTRDFLSVRYANRTATDVIVQVQDAVVVQVAVIVK